MHARSPTARAHPGPVSQGSEPAAHDPQAAAELAPAGHDAGGPGPWAQGDDGTGGVVGDRARHPD